MVYKSTDLAVPKSLAITADGLLVAADHPAARQILAHFPGQEVPTAYLDAANLLDDRKEAYRDRPYDDVPIPGATGPAVESAPAAASLTIEDVLANPKIAAAIEAKIADTVKDAVAAAEKANAEATKRLIAEALKAAGVGKQ